MELSGTEIAPCLLNHLRIIIVDYSGVENQVFHWCTECAHAIAIHPYFGALNPDLKFPISSYSPSVSNIFTRYWLT